MVPLSPVGGETSWLHRVDLVAYYWVEYAFLLSAILFAALLFFRLRRVHIGLAGKFIVSAIAFALLVTIVTERLIHFRRLRESLVDLFGYDGAFFAKVKATALLVSMLLYSCVGGPLLLKFLNY